MITLENHIGAITVSEKYIRDLISSTATGCFGVAEMSESHPLLTLISGIASRNSRMKKNKGVIVSTKDNKLKIDLHIKVAYGVNVAAITDSIINKVKFAVNQALDMEVSELNVFIDNIE